jgi:glyoxylase-like metal-dependent hydrolase (beta-lactamase superfamily II)
VKICDIEVIETPGHTPGHVSFLYGEGLFAGNLVASRKGKLTPTPKFMSWNKEEVSGSIDKLKNFQSMSILYLLVEDKKIKMAHFGHPPIKKDRDNQLNILTICPKPFLI